ncbi:MAG: hypothetical protein EBQ96_03180 [Proteobacteria bacterium]|nr:hypothetical protein [Pseudomonadota bacterium]
MSDNAKKFLFDGNDFSEEALRKKREAARRPSFSEAQMEASRKSGFDEGRKAGIAETLNSQEAQIRDTLQQVILAASRLESEENKRVAAFIDQSALLAVQAMVRTIPVLMELLSREQINLFMKQVLAEQVRGQTLVLYVPPLHFASIKDRFEKMLEQSRRKISCTINPDDSLTGLQCRFEWTGGGADWDPEAVSKNLLQKLVSHLPENLRADALQAREGVDEPSQKAHNEPSSSGDVS